ncbi:M20/M25/M40 family metallo-hydrolase [Parasphingopyxis sp. CP4]|uniref:M28 family peptidase n=1 Tax=Parasphingopyxis sp. CP4 TaxID=2724527 RepID=UPI00159FBFE6|nr:M28 family peptidase [Parasphingopyxis sp. CP4]QLC21438.1 M20/M25/M40 family metallo-hydrolase [Parasphingopyxis sp. CP4]
MFLRFFGLILAIFLALPASAQRLPNEGDLRRHIEILASEEFEGRQPGTAGEALTASYIASEFSAAGILPGYHGNYLQAVALVDRSDARAILIGSNNDDLDSVDGEIIALGNQEDVSIDGLPVTFVGYGLEAGETDTSSTTDVRFDGQAVLLLRGAPEGIDNPPSFRTRLAFYRERGATAIIGIALPDTPWDASLNSLRFRQTYFASDARSPVEAIISAAAYDRHLAGSLGAYAELTRSAQAQEFTRQLFDLQISLRVTTRVDRYDGINVVGFIPGSGASGEAVLFSAHHDHFGICRPEDPDNQTCNGAVDNASGTAAVIEVARALAADEQAERDIYFVTTTAEESGLLGAIAFAEAPPLPLENILAVFNLDTIAIAPRGAAVGIIGRGMTPLDTLIDQVAIEYGRTVDTGLEMNSFVRRNDAWAFMERGVAAVMVGGSFTDPELLNGFLSGRYHRNTDEIDGIELGGAHEDTLLHIGLGRAFSDPQRYPTPER